MAVAEIFDSMSYGPAPESAEPAHAWLRGWAGATQLFIDGAFTPAETGQSFATVNPATGSELIQVAHADSTDIDRAVAAARQAQPGWAARPGHERARFLYAIARAVQRHSRLFAVLESLENGKPIRETRDADVPLVARHFYYHAGWAQLQETQLADYKPVGVAGQIIPWNFPLLMLAWKIAPAIALGNTVVLKPAEYTSLTALRFAELCQEIGLPAGVVNIVTGEGTTGQELAAHDGLDKLAFTGSTAVGRELRRASAGTDKKLTQELGGKSPFIVFDDADLDAAVEGLVDAIWFNQGQVCCAGSRLLVQEGVAERLHAKIRERMEKLRVGDPLDKAIDLGAIVAPVQLERIQSLVAQGQKEGATLWQPSWAVPKEGYFYPPTLFTGVSPAATIAQEEIFGPVLVSMTFRTPEEAVALANNTPYGLAASVWTESVNLALDMAPQLAAGVVWTNCTNVFDAAAGFGGYKESGFGREGGGEGLDEYLKPFWANGQAGPAKSRGKTKGAGKAAAAPANAGDEGPPPVDRTHKLYIGGKQARPDGNYARAVVDPAGRRIEDVGEGNRKDIRDAVEAARKAPAWRQASAHGRAQVLYYIAENLSLRETGFAQQLARMGGVSEADGRAEVAASVRALFAAAAWCDKFEGRIHTPPMRGLALALPEPLGLVGIVCPREAPLLAFATLAGAALATGNRVIAVPSEDQPLAATDFYQVLETSDLPGGALNIVTGARDSLAPVLAEHAELDGLAYFGPASGRETVERLSAGNLKRTWTQGDNALDWYEPRLSGGIDLLNRFSQTKTVWVPYGE